MAKGKLKSILIKLMSGAGTGYFYVCPPAAFRPLSFENNRLKRPAPAYVHLGGLAGTGAWEGWHRGLGGLHLGGLSGTGG